jgi:hypothetical protein
MRDRTEARGLAESALCSQVIEASKLVLLQGGMGPDGRATSGAGVHFLKAMEAAAQDTWSAASKASSRALVKNPPILTPLSSHNVRKTLAEKDNERYASRLPPSKEYFWRPVGQREENG